MCRDWRGRAALLLAIACLALLVPVATAASASASTAPSIAAAVTPNGKGYWMVQTDGTVTAFGNAKTRHGGDAPDAVGIASTPSGKGYWIATRNGNVITHGDAKFYGTLAFLQLARPIVGIAPTKSGKGYWMVASDGGVFAFGDAHFHGSTGGMQLVAPVVGMARAPAGHGYWLVASDGGVFSFGTAHFHGSTGGMRLVAPVIGINATRSGRGYGLVAADGGVFAFGRARFYGSMGGRQLSAPVVQLAITANGRGYWEFAIDGGVFAFGNAPFYGSAPHEVGGDFVFPFQDRTAVSPPSTWVEDQGVDMFLQNRGADACGSISQPSRADGPVLVAVAAGTIAGAGIDGFGSSAPVLHVEQGPLAGMYVYYGHASGNLVPVGAHVTQGQPITHVGCGIVGRSDEPHVEIGMAPSYPGVPPCGPGCHSSSTSGAMLGWLLTTYGH